MRSLSDVPLTVGDWSEFVLGAWMADGNLSGTTLWRDGPPSTGLLEAWMLQQVRINILKVVRVPEAASVVLPLISPSSTNTIPTGLVEGRTSRGKAAER
jgi:hypothetical protein